MDDALTSSRRRSHLSQIAYESLEDVQQAIRSVRDIFEPDWSLTPEILIGQWRIRYTPRPIVQERAS
jgi:hypothetical protein